MNYERNESHGDEDEITNYGKETKRLREEEDEMYREQEVCKNVNDVTYKPSTSE